MHNAIQASIIELLISPVTSKDVAFGLDDADSAMMTPILNAFTKMAAQPDS